MDSEARMAYWQMVTQESERLAEALAQVVERQDLGIVRGIEALTGYNWLIQVADQTVLCSRYPPHYRAELAMKQAQLCLY